MQVFSWFIFFCISVGDPVIKRGGLLSHYTVYPRHIFIPVPSQDLDFQPGMLCFCCVCSVSWGVGWLFCVCSVSWSVGGLFVLLILVILLTITVKIFFSYTIKENIQSEHGIHDIHVLIGLVCVTCTKFKLQISRCSFHFNDRQHISKLRFVSANPVFLCFFLKYVPKG